MVQLWRGRARSEGACQGCPSSATLHPPPPNRVTELRHIRNHAVPINECWYDPHTALVCPGPLLDRDLRPDDRLDRFLCNMAALSDRLVRGLGLAVAALMLGHAVTPARGLSPHATAPEAFIGWQGDTYVPPQVRRGRQGARRAAAAGQQLRVARAASRQLLLRPPRRRAPPRPRALMRTVAARTLAPTHAAEGRRRRALVRMGGRGKCGCERLVQRRLQPPLQLPGAREGMPLPPIGLWV